MEWFGATHYMELIDDSEGSAKKMHAVFASTVPRVGEIIAPQAGSLMRVVAVQYVAADINDSPELPHRILIPYVYLESVDEGEDEATG